MLRATFNCRNRDVKGFWGVVTINCQASCEDDEAVSVKTYNSMTEADGDRRKMNGAACGNSIVELCYFHPSFTMSVNVPCNLLKCFASWEIDSFAKHSESMQNAVQAAAESRYPECRTWGSSGRPELD